MKEATHEATAIDKLAVLPLEGAPARPASAGWTSGARTQNPNMCTPYLRAISTKIEIISTTRGSLHEYNGHLRYIWLKSMRITFSGPSDALPTRFFAVAALSGM